MRLANATAKAHSYTLAVSCSQLCVTYIELKNAKKVSIVFVFYIHIGYSSKIIHYIENRYMYEIHTVSNVCSYRMYLLPR